MRNVHIASSRQLGCCRTWWWASAGSLESSASSSHAGASSGTNISAEAEAAATTQEGKVGRSGLCSGARSVGSAMSVIGSLEVCGRF